MPVAKEADAPTEKPNRMARRRMRTRAQIMDAVETLVLERGYDDTSAEAIAEQADLGRSTFYNHFDNKPEAVLATLSERYREIGEAAYIPLEDTPDRAVSIIKSSRRVFEEIAAEPLTAQLVERPRLLVQALAASQAEFMASDLEEGLNQGRLQLPVGLDSLATAMAWTMVGLLIRAVTTGEVAATLDDFSRLVLINLGIEPAEVDDVLKQAVQK